MGLPVIIIHIVIILSFVTCLQVYLIMSLFHHIKAFVFFFFVFHFCCCCYTLGYKTKRHTQYHINIVRGVRILSPNTNLAQSREKISVCSLVRSFIHSFLMKFISFVNLAGAEWEEGHPPLLTPPWHKLLPGIVFQPQMYLFNRVHDFPVLLLTFCFPVQCQCFFCF